MSTIVLGEFATIVALNKEPPEIRWIQLHKSSVSSYNPVPAQLLFRFLACLLCTETHGHEQTQNFHTSGLALPPGVIITVKHMQQLSPSLAWPLHLQYVYIMVQRNTWMLLIITMLIRNYFYGMIEWSSNWISSLEKLTIVVAIQIWTFEVNRNRNFPMSPSEAWTLNSTTLRLLYFVESFCNCTMLERKTQTHNMSLDFL